MTKQLLGVALTGCIAWAASSAPVKADPIYIEVEAAPLRIETYPHTVYEGRPVYYVEGRWYYRHGPRWAYYREEPRPLIEYRSSPAYRYYDRGDRYDRREYRGNDRREYREHRNKRNHGDRGRGHRHHH
jgi:hypothetical protein